MGERQEHGDYSWKNYREVEAECEHIVKCLAALAPPRSSVMLCLDVSSELVSLSLALVLGHYIVLHLGSLYLLPNLAFYFAHRKESGYKVDTLSALLEEGRPSLLLIDHSRLEIATQAGRKFSSMIPLSDPPDATFCLLCSYLVHYLHNEK